MNKGNKSSYQRFRRKSSLNSFENTQSSTPDPSFMKNKRHQDLKEVEDLSMELEKITQKSYSSQHFAQNNSSLSLKSQQDKTPHSRSKLRHATSLTQLDLAEFEEEEEKSEKKRNLTFFNKFETIEESQAFFEEEDILENDSSSLNSSSKTAVPLKSTQPAKQTYKPPTSRKVNPPPNTKTNIQSTAGRDKLRHDISELDNMKKELENKRSKKETPNSKPIPTIAVFKKTKEPPVLSESRMSAPVQPRKIETPKTALRSNAKGASIQAKGEAKKMEPLVKMQEQQMVAKRMLTEKEKATLIKQVMELRTIIEKTQICADNLPEIAGSLDQIKKLVTR